ncbi:phosphatase PAP2 family protein [Pseudonocardia oroxyli]|uniref:Undecaprenyl-diphosphatase n=1 Tax=Pseudonocardia oroxyli TaxID=366584 RepID=A0A1G7ZV46_PSEOR|nr:phosphatase PAP2 family protein [Pseudonocardia oroxyli]SDH12523.1 undecaprenyl-diphosphatase [Pseudonocardia oroxyli]
MRRPLLLVNLVAGVLVVLAALLTWAAFTGVGPAARDTAALSVAVDDRTPLLTSAAVVFTNIGSTAAMALLALVVGVLLWVRGHRLDGLWLVATMVTAGAVFTLVKRLLDRPRPPESVRLVEVGNTSLPSGHATMSAAVVGALVVLAWPHLHGLWTWLVPGAAVLWIGGIGATRIYLGVHWFSDVVAGWATGLAWLAVCTGVLLRARTRAATPVP